MRTWRSFCGARFGASGASLKGPLIHFLAPRTYGRGEAERKRIFVRPRPLGLPPGISYDDVEELVEALEGPATSDRFSTPTFSYMRTIRLQITREGPGVG